MMKQAIAAIIACMALTASVVAQECMICPGGSLRDYWILQIKVIRVVTVFFKCSKFGQYTPLSLRFMRDIVRTSTETLRDT